MIELNDLFSWLISLPLIGRLALWVASVPEMQLSEVVQDGIEFFLKMLGLSEFIKWLYRRLIGYKKIDLYVAKIELLEKEVAEERLEIKNAISRNFLLNDELKIAKSRLPEHALSVAKREWHDNNQDLANRVLEKWISENADVISEIATAIARHRIAHSIPDPADHLSVARNLLMLAKVISPGKIDANELWREFDQVSGQLQEQLIRGGAQQIGWNSNLSLEPQINTCLAVALHCFYRGHWRLARIFAERAANLALTEGSLLKPLWFRAETEAAFMQALLGGYSEALRRVDRALTDARSYLSSENTLVLRCCYVKSCILNNLGRNDEALREIERFAPIQLKELGERNPDVLNTREKRAYILSKLGRYSEALSEIDRFAPIQVEVLGVRHPNVLITKELRARMLQHLGRYAGESHLKKVEEAARTCGALG